MVHPRDASVWRKFAVEKRERNALDVLDRLQPDTVMWDIGASVGLMGLFASRRCKRVMCFEPDPVEIQHLAWNINRNRIKNVSLVGAALGAKTAFLEMGAAGGEDLGTGHTGFYVKNPAKAVTCPVLGPQAWQAWLETEPPDFIKMDIEGGEFELLPLMADWLKAHRPKMLLSLHAFPMMTTGFMTEAQAKAALEETAKLLSFYGEFVELHSEQKFPISEIPARMLIKGKAWSEGIYLE